MESNGAETYLDGWGMSIATQRAKERENQTPDVKVMDKTVKHGRLISQGSDIRDLMSRNLRENALQEPDVRANGRISGMAGCPGVGPDVRAPNPRMNSRNSILGRKLMISGAKLQRFRGWKVEKLGEMLDPLETKQIHGSKSTKHHQTNKSQKKWGLFLVGIFEYRQEHTKLG